MFRFGRPDRGFSNIASSLDGISSVCVFVCVRWSVAFLGPPSHGLNHIADSEASGGQPNPRPHLRRSPDDASKQPPRVVWRWGGWVEWLGMRVWPIGYCMCEASKLILFFGRANEDLWPADPSIRMWPLPIKADVLGSCFFVVWSGAAGSLKIRHGRIVNILMKKKTAKEVQK